MWVVLENKPSRIAFPVEEKKNVLMDIRNLVTFIKNVNDIHDTTNFKKIGRGKYFQSNCSILTRIYFFVSVVRCMNNNDSSIHTLLFTISTLLFFYFMPVPINFQCSYTANNRNTKNETNVPWLTNTASKSPSTNIHNVYYT